MTTGLLVHVKAGKNMYFPRKLENEIHYPICATSTLNSSPTQPIFRHYHSQRNTFRNPYIHVERVLFFKDLMSLDKQQDIFNRGILQQMESSMVLIPAGSLAMRDDRTGQHWVTQVPSFQLSKYLVTQQWYEAVLLSSPSTFRGPNLPVETVSWKDAALFCNRLSELAGLTPYYQIGIKAEDFGSNAQSNGYRLPTEAEWVYACRAGNSDIRYGVLEEIGWYRGNSGGSTQEVGQKQPNAWGLYDMIGNVWEWCSDIYDASVYGSYRIIRGGGWYDEPRGCLVTNRRRSHPIAYKMDDLGFRIARIA